MSKAIFNGGYFAIPKSVSFELYSADEIRKMSVVQVITPLSMSATGHGLPGGLYDPLMGPHNMAGICKTCQKNLLNCAGHFGHIELPLPVINPLLSKTVLQILRLTCITCNSVIIPVGQKYLAITQLKLLEFGLVEAALEAERVMTELVEDLPEEAEGEAKKKKKSETVAPEIAKAKFISFLKEKLTGKEEKVTENSKGIEGLKHIILRRVLRFAMINYKCPWCETACKRIVFDQSKILYSLCKEVSKGRTKKSRLNAEEEATTQDDDGGSVSTVTSQKYLTPSEARIHLQAVWMKEKDFLEYIFPLIKASKSEFPTDVFFIEVLPVPPPKNRPSQTANNVTIEHPINLPLRHAISSCTIMQYILKAMQIGKESLSPEAQKALESIMGNNYEDKLERTWNQLQSDVDHVMDRDKPLTTDSAGMVGLKQIIEKKDGLFRMNMMGKRVNYAARTVITPDPNINIDEIGIPDVFAKTLTFPCNVSPANVYHMRQLVINGPLQHPGAVAVEDERGMVTRLNPFDKASREGVANRLLVSDTLNQSEFVGLKTVHRHLQNGDLLLLNRQPSLHRPSIMAHRARVLPGEKVFRLHYANCKHYNADFDGDEMNAHFPQDEESRAEASSLVNVCNHFLVPKDGTPLGGLIQDHVIGAVKLTTRGRFFAEEDYYQLVFFALSNRHVKIKVEPPTILKPVPLWSGKQVITTIIRNLTPKDKQPLSFTSMAKIKTKDWTQWQSRPLVFGGPIVGDELSESLVIFRYGELLTGILDKVHLGATPNGLCHAFYELYGSQAVGMLLSAFSRLITSFLQWEGFTLGIKDVLVMPLADKDRKKTMEKAKEMGSIAAAAAFGLSATTDPNVIEANLETVHRSRDPKARANVDQSYKRLLDKVTNKINSACLPFGLVSIFPNNNLQLMVQSGAKGSTVNTMQMSCLLGQIELEGKRPPLTIAGKSLPSFKPYDTSPRAGGFILGRFLTGIRPQEFFFHCMAGREGLIDTAVKTSRSGYLQRCLVKLMEGVVTQYDMTVRDSDGSVVQFLYGEDGLDVCKSQYLKPKQMKFLEDNSKCVTVYKLPESIDHDDQMDEIERLKRQVKKWELADPTRKIRTTGFTAFCKKRAKDYRDLTGINPVTRRSLQAEALENRWRSMSEEEQSVYYRKGKKSPAPVLGTRFPSTFGVISEKLQKTIDEFDPDPEFRHVLYSKAMAALSNPGDAVGVLAAQSIGEPSTQMTLNTFHFAGRGEMNVTLGIPRLREILMVASENIRTPSMDIPFQKHVSEAEAEELKTRLTKVDMAQILEKIEVTETLHTSGDRGYRLKFVCLPYEEYKNVFFVTPASILRYVEDSFIAKRLLPAIENALKSGKGSATAHSETLGKSKRKLFGRSRKEDGNDEGPVETQDDNNENERRPGRNIFEEQEKKGQGEEHESSDEEALPEDADATHSRRLAQQHEREYEDAEDNDVELVNEESNEEDDDAQASKDDSNTKDVNGEIDLSDVLEKQKSSKYSVKTGDYERRVAKVKNIEGFVSSYSFDKRKQEWFTIMLRIPQRYTKFNVGYVLKELMEKSVIHQVPRINRAFVVTVSNEFYLKTEGINILAMTKFQDILDLNRLHCNNIHTMAQHYGIEAALKVLIKELSDVFKAYGIIIDPRHLSLIADYMMTSGSYRPFNRVGIGSSTSPLHQMSFETVVNFLREAALGGKRDDLQNPSACLSIGKPVKVGTELFDCFATPDGLPRGGVSSRFRSGRHLRKANDVGGNPNYGRIYTTAMPIKKPKEGSGSAPSDPYSYLSTSKSIE